MREKERIILRILFVGDVVGHGGRRAVSKLIPGLLDEYNCDFCIVNGENMAGGNGMTHNCIQEISNCGIDVFTSGDHVWDQRGFSTEIINMPNVLRPANLPEEQPGRGFGIFTSRKNNYKVGVLNLLGRVFVGMSSNCPFAAAERIVAEMRKECKVIIVDMHAEATSEKIAMGRFLDGKVSAVLGTHTHVPTADQQIFPGKTAFISDVGMVGSRESILGRQIEPVLSKFRFGMPKRFTVNDADIRLHGVVISVDEKTGKASGIERVMRDIS